MPKIKSIKGLEILDSRGRPTVKAYIHLDNGSTVSASVPSGASTGRSEAHELRDGGNRFNGLGCQKAVENINETINSSLSGQIIDSQNSMDELLTQLDGTSDKSNLGANAILAVSLAFARAMAQENQQPLYRYFSALSGNKLESMPRPTINLFSGGKHAGGQIPIQDLLIVPMQSTISKALECSYAVYQAAAKLCLEEYQMRSLTADEGGLAPPFTSLDELFSMALRSIEDAGYSPGKEVNLALDVASRHFYTAPKYLIDALGKSGEQMVAMFKEWISKYPIVSLEDGLAEEDWEHWGQLNNAIGSKCLVLGDDFLCTNTARVEQAIKLNSEIALLLKVNQVGTVSEALTAMKTAKAAQWEITASARSGETEDDWLSDLAVGWQAEYIKIGSITQSERLAKYNRLLEIEQELQLTIRD